MRASLEALRHELTASDSADFGQLMTTFFDLIEADPELLAESEPCNLPELLRAALERIIPEMGGNGAVLVEARLLRHGPERLVHGTLVLGGRPATVLFFEGASVGLISVTVRGGETLSSRFRVLGSARGAELN